MRGGVAAILAAAATAVLACGCTAPTDSAETTEATARPATSTWPEELPESTPNTPAPTTTSTAAPTTSGPPPDDIEARITAAGEATAARGGDLSMSLFDRVTGDRWGLADGDVVETASVAKLFIADEILHKEPALSDEESDLLARMLEQSDDDAANTLWYRYGGGAIVDDVADRYSLADTYAPWDDNWWNTLTTTDDLVDYYTELLDGSGGLDADSTAVILGHLRKSTTLAADGYDQRFGIPDGLGAQSAGDIAVKQGWMCCMNGRWVHLSTAVVGPDSRYVLVVAVHETVDYEDADDDQIGWDREDGDDPYLVLPDTSIDSAVDDASAAHARETMTLVVRTLFPEERIG